ncbi:hypothetical protein Abol_052_002 [Acetobacter orleanensis JCM 7639]|nr:hypothetical protein Abol_052_002 [Acetobacter orleanensis JCM 7639]
MGDPIRSKKPKRNYLQQRINKNTLAGYPPACHNKKPRSTSAVFYYGVLFILDSIDPHPFQITAEARKTNPINIDDFAIVAHCEATKMFPMIETSLNTVTEFVKSSAMRDEYLAVPF